MLFFKDWLLFSVSFGFTCSSPDSAFYMLGSQVCAAISHFFYSILYIITRMLQTASFVQFCFFLCKPNQNNSWKKSSLKGETKPVRLQGHCFSASPLKSESSPITPKSQELLLTPVCFHLTASPKLNYMMGWL